MSGQIEYRVDRASATEIADHLLRCDAEFVPPLSERVEIIGYAHKIAAKATRFEAWSNGVLVGLVAAYCNDSGRRAAYITSTSVLHRWQGAGIASRLLELCIALAKEQGFARIELEVNSGNGGAVRLYANKGFTIDRMNDSAAIMCLDIAKDA